MSPSSTWHRVHGDSEMITITESHGRLAAATGLRSLLWASCEAFEVMLAVLRHHQEDDQSAFAALVLAGNAAANGRDCIAFAPSLPIAARVGEADVLARASVTDVMLAVSGLARDLANRLS